MNRLSTLFLLAFNLLVGCSGNNELAGGSSGVENPEVVLAFNNRSGMPTSFTGTVRIFAADQSPVIEPDAISQFRVEADSIAKLTRSHFSGGDTSAATAFNVLMTGEDSSGAMLQTLTYNPIARKFSLGDNPEVSRIRVPLVKLVRYRASLDRVSKEKLERVIVPGSPFQSVVVDSHFIFEMIPKGVYPLRMIRNYSEEIRLPDSLNTAESKRYRVDTSAPPVARPPTTPPPDIRVDAGEDQSVSILAQTFLSGSIAGVGAENPRLAILWRQLSPDPQLGGAVIENPGQLETRVTFNQTGTYRFILLTSYEMILRKDDTVVVDVKATAFVEPDPGDTLSMNSPFAVAWSDEKARTLTLQYTVNGGSLWGNISANLPSQVGLNSFTWTPTKAPYTNCFMRLLEGNQEVARSGRFVLLTP